jgi:DNA-binding transcriptional MocR family regulator
MADGWNLKLEGDGATFYERIANAIERDIRDGVLRNGSRLPPQRRLANQLGLSVGTITKAYLEIEKRGLVRGYVGRGTYITGASAEVMRGGACEPLVDLSQSIIPHQAASRRYADHRGKFNRRTDLFEALAYSPPAGTDATRRASAKWLRQIAHFEIPWERLVVTTGSQHAMALALGALCRPGDTVLCEAETSAGMKSLAAHRGYRLHGLKMDAEGVLPGDLERAISQTKAGVLYIMPTAQIPTGRTMGAERREAIARIARQHKTWIIEDDNFALFANRGREKRVPIATLAPDQSFYIGGVSKSIAPGLRLGFLSCPPGPSMDAVTNAIRATVCTSSALGGLLFHQWVEDGTAFQIAETVREEVERRIEVAYEILGPLLGPRRSHAPHLWLPMTLLEAEQVADRARRVGVAVAAYTDPIMRGAIISGIGVCLGAAASITQLTIGLERLQTALAPEIQRLRRAVA